MIVILCFLTLSSAINAISNDIECQDDIDESLNKLPQDDERLIDLMKNYYLMSPASSDTTYNIPPERLTAPKINGQFQQALIVDLLYNSSKTNGFFVEAGAFDGFAASNSLYFEVKRNWTGLLVEAHPDNYEVLTSTNRRAWSLGTCLSIVPKPQTVEFDAATIFGGIIQEGRPKPGDSLPSNQRHEMQELSGMTRRTIRMQCLPLYTALAALDNPTVDYMSLDVEGAEEGILQSLPWDKVDIKIIGLEIIVKKLDETATGDHHNAYPGIKELLESKGYEMIRGDWHSEEKKSMEAYFAKKDIIPHLNRKYFKQLE